MQLGTEVTRLRGEDGGPTRAAGVPPSRRAKGRWLARNVVLANGAYQLPADSARRPPNSPATSAQLHSHDYRNPAQLPDGAVLVVGTGQSGGQITEDLLAAGREVHLSVSACPEAPRRYRGQDTSTGSCKSTCTGRTSASTPCTAEQLPSPAARFTCNPLISGNDGGHSIRLRELGRSGVRLHGHFEGTDDGVLTFSDDLAARMALAEAGFGQRMQAMLDAFIAAAGIEAPAGRSAGRRLAAPGRARLDLDAEGITSVIWSTGYGLDFGFLDIPVLDGWNYPRHARGRHRSPRPRRRGLPG